MVCFLTPHTLPFIALPQDQVNESPVLAIYDNERRLLKRAFADNEEETDPIGFSMSQELRDMHTKHVNGRHLGHMEDNRQNSPKNSKRNLQLSDMQDDLMTLVFERCLFWNNTQSPPVDDIPTYGVISARSPDNIIEVYDSIFLDNVYGGGNAGVSSFFDFGCFPLTPMLEHQLSKLTQSFV